MAAAYAAGIFFYIVKVHKMNESDILNRSEALERLGGDNGLYQALLNAFLDEYKNNPNELIRLKAVLSGNGDALLKTESETLCKEAHKIKGAAYTIGANALGNAALALESFFKDKNNRISEKNISAITPLLNNFSEAYEKTMSEIGKTPV